MTEMGSSKVFELEPSKQQNHSRWHSDDTCPVVDLSKTETPGTLLPSLMNYYYM